ncbi:MAG: von Willebrand factor, type [Candidatus Solibacter sp.]|nr:von Willebrand factor, type [Candidatus Solibacter sp.]
MSALRVFAARSLCGLLLCVPAVPQQTPPQPPAAPTPQGAPQSDAARAQFRTQVTDVIVPVTVTDDKGRFVSNLVKKDFRVLDEGKPQNIEFFTHDEKQPIVAGFLVDLSNNSRIHWKTYQDAILELVWNLLPGDKRYTGYLISYGNTADIAVNTTWDSDKIADKVRKMKPGGGAALFDAIYLACTRRELVKGEPYEPRRVIIVIGDGHDNASKHNLEEVLELAQRNLVTVYAVSTMAFGFSNEAQDVLERLTHKTGGHVEYPLNSLYKNVSGYLSNPSDDGNYALTVGTGGYAAEISNGIIKAVGGIGGEITTQYILRYKPDIDQEAKPKQYRKITVDIPGLPNVKISAREGYFPNEVPGMAPAETLKPRPDATPPKGTGGGR